MRKLQPRKVRMLFEVLLLLRHRASIQNVFCRTSKPHEAFFLRETKQDQVASKETQRNHSDNHNDSKIKNSGSSNAT